jgi:hypothetical protein
MSADGREHHADRFGRRNVWQDGCGERQAEQREQTCDGEVRRDGGERGRTCLSESGGHRYLPGMSDIDVPARQHPAPNSEAVRLKLALPACP